MKNIIVTIGEIMLGVIIFGLIFIGDDSIRAEAQTLFTETITKLQNLTP